MRLSEPELSSIKKLVSEYDPNARLFLFGSRVDDLKRGGDIDLYIESSIPFDLKTIYMMQHKISMACDIDVDLIVKRPDDEDEPIYEIARNTGVRL